MRVKPGIVLLLLALALPAGTARAAEAVPGGACTTANFIQETGGPETSGVRHILICDGAHWQEEATWLANRNMGVGTATPAAVLDVNGGARIGYNPGGCSGTNKGELRYSSSGDAWTYCNGSAWTPFESAGGACNAVGNVCSADGTVYIGNSPLDGAPLYATRCDLGRTFVGMICTGTRTTTYWDDGNGNVTDALVGYVSDGYDGHFNTTALATGIDSNSSAGGIQAHLAAKACRDLTVNGYSDWYLPSYAEASLFMAAHTIIGDIQTDGYPFGEYWLSNQSDDSYGAEIVAFSDPPYYDGFPKEEDHIVRCIRKPAATSGETAPTGCAGIGNACSDGTIYAGNHPLLPGTKIYVTAADQSSAAAWAGASSNTGADSSYNGSANQAWIAYNATIANFAAFQLCKNLTANGHSDWYLPSRYELNLLYTNKAAIGGFGTGNYWSSTEASNANARRQAFNTGTSSSSAKTGTAAVRCVRKDNFD